MTIGTGRAVGVCLSLCLPEVLLAVPTPRPCARQGVVPGPNALRAVVLVEGETDPSVAQAIAALGANTAASLNPPDPAAGANLAASGLSYIARILVRDVERLPSDAAAIARLRAIPALSGLEYYDDTVTEGYATPETQARAYGILKALFPDLLVLYAERLDPVATDPAYLDGFFRPDFTDLLVPYFYPVGNTILGPQQETDDWEDRLRALLEPVAACTPAGKGILPVLQAFEQTGYPLSGGLLRRQVEVYEELWPEHFNAALFAWTVGGELHGMSEIPVLRRAASALFGELPAPPMPCVVAR
ncbi:MAG TPA: hypothetical protein VGK26_10935 [Thermoanaerobaculia bacterium]|jgi:hypothetical protein